MNLFYNILKEFLYYYRTTNLAIVKMYKRYSNILLKGRWNISVLKHITDAWKVARKLECFRMPCISRIRKNAKIWIGGKRYEMKIFFLISWLIILKCIVSDLLITTYVYYSQLIWFMRDISNLYTCYQQEDTFSSSMPNCPDIFHSNLDVSSTHAQY